MPPIRSISAGRATLPVGVSKAAERLQVALDTHRPCAPVRDLIGSGDIAAAYLVQEQLTQTRLARGSSIVGRKIGLTSHSVQQQLGVDRPDFGVLFSDMQFTEDDGIPMNRLMQPRIEAEIAFTLDDDLVDGPLDLAQVGDAVGTAVAALEIVDSRIADWDITFGDTVADNASSGLYVLGGEPRALAQVQPVDAKMTMSVNAVVVSSGSGQDCLGDPLAALRWLAMTARDLGNPLLAGQVILSGALGRMVPINPHDEVVAHITGFGRVKARFGPAAHPQEENRG